MNHSEIYLHWTKIKTGEKGHRVSKINYTKYIARTRK